MVLQGENVAEHEDGVRVERFDDVLRVTLANAATRNAQTPATWRRLAAVPDYLDQSVRAVVLTAEGPSFCAGLDRRMLTPEGVPGEESLLTLSAHSPEQMDGFIRQAQSAFTWWREVPQVTIALVHGHAIGAGFQLALACDVLIVADDAQLAMRETSLGLTPDLGGTQPLVDRVGYARAFEICARGRFVGAQEAVRLGIATEQVPTERWDAYVDEFLTPIRAALPNAVGALKSLLQGAASNEDQLARERSAQLARLTELRVMMGD
jgi:enoyl-CoA hydratase/carnithine racemase